MKKNQFFKPLSFMVITAAMIISCKKDNGYEELPAPQNKTAMNSKKSLTGSSALGQTSAARAVVQNEIIYNTDYVSAGVGGLRDIGNGVISLSGTSGTITKAYLYWHGVTNTSADVGNSIIVNGVTVNGTNIGLSWGYGSFQYTQSQAYRADVTALVQATGNGTYSLSGFGDMNPNGASLIVFFDDGNNANNRDVEIFEGNDSNLTLYNSELYPNDPGGWEVNFTGFTYNSGSANIQMHVAEGNSGFENWDGVLWINDQELTPLYNHLFDGNSVPPANNDGLWDIRTFNISSFLAPGLNTLTLALGSIEASSNNGNDFLGLIVALLDVPAGTTPVTNIDVPFDFKPNSCPNPFNVTEKGKVTAAILGKAGFDISKIDVSTVKLNGVPATQILVQDVATPYAGAINDCNSCSTAGLDGIMDLKFEVSIATLAATLGTVSNNQCIEVQLTGNLLPQFGGTPITGLDKIRIIKKK